MALPRSLGKDLFKYRRRKRASLDGSVPGLAQSRFHKSRRYVSGMPYVPRRAGYQHDIYNWGTPGEYHPSLNAPAVDWTEYDQYEPLGMHHISGPNNPRLPHDLDDNSREMPIPTSLPEDDLALTEQFLMVMGRRDEIEQGSLEGPRFNINETDLSEPIPFESPLPVEERSIDELPSLEDLKDAFVQLSEVLPEDHPDLVNVRTAMRRVRDHQISLSEMNDMETDALSFYPMGVESDPLNHDPLQEAEQFFNRQMELLGRSFDEPEMGSAGIQTPDLFEGGSLESGILPDETLPDEFFMEEQTLEQMVCDQDPFDAPAPGFMEQDVMPDELLPEMGMPGVMPDPMGYDASMIADEINHAIDEVSQQPLQEMEPDPFQPEYAPYMTGQNMLGQMQYMANPFGMPGPYGSMGPMPGP